MILPDTDIFIDAFQNHPPAVAWANSVRTQRPALPGFVALELLAGCRNRREVESIDARISTYSILWPTAAACDAILPVFASLHVANALGLVDCLIAATALCHQLRLHTVDQNHFSAVPGLQTIQPYTR